jgi:hypothetical protein
MLGNYAKENKSLEIFMCWIDVQVYARYVYIYIYIYTYMYTYIYMYIYMHTCIYLIALTISMISLIFTTIINEHITQINSKIYRNINQSLQMTIDEVKHYIYIISISKLIQFCKLVVFMAKMLCIIKNKLI